MREYEEKKSEKVLEQNVADEKAMCVQKKYGDTWLFLYLYRIYTGRQVFNKKQCKGIALKCQKQYNIIGKNLVLLFDAIIRKTQFKIMKMEG